jgi:hypothetical protein
LARRCGIVRANVAPWHFSDMPILLMTPLSGKEPTSKIDCPTSAFDHPYRKSPSPKFLDLLKRV